MYFQQVLFALRLREFMNPLLQHYLYYLCCQECLSVLFFSLGIAYMTDLLPIFYFKKGAIL